MTVPEPPEAPTPSGVCATCGATTSGGRFCSSCGALLAGTSCPACRAAVPAGARFCHHCGVPLGAGTPAAVTAAVPIANGPRSRNAVLPWAIAALAIVALGGLIVGRNLGVALARNADTPTASVAAPSPDGGAASGAATGTEDAGGISMGGGGTGGVRAPDISGMSPRERADRLFDRVMRLSDAGKRDSVDFFVPMVLSAYQMLGTLDADEHYDVGRIGEVAGMPELARAEADTILRAQPTHLLGLILAAEAATSRKTPADARRYYGRFLSARATELAKDLPEYERHRNDIEAAAAEATKWGAHGAS